MKSFFEFNRNSPEERQERNKLYPELAKFHIALREEMSEEEYQAYYTSEQESSKSSRPILYQTKHQWISAY
ncbi:CRISPR/Cas system endoribonuclease Cas6 (RAMP superfamily) [Pontibacter aydingkolensis]|uniref:Uncharacterized protein n=1 Tax=Pontibacter aydingkolensis TaxID=1911536 RepID=A0ABS7CYF5_9BACT|nr:hypothetical protein [Pontibacter aydingkolensis]MBW7468878.1 hypothetical protein [Pontibacter aydingkolensis]